MSDWSALDLARLQFGFTIAFHIIFPAITIGLASYLVVLEACWLASRQAVYRDLHHFWSKIFALSFGMGVVSGVVMAYQFGTNWSRFADFAGSITGPLLTYEVLTAFFLEAGFLGVMLFGEKRVGPVPHFLSTLMVALGTLVSATWIIASNSWMQTPRGYRIADGRAIPADWLQVIFNPSFPYRLAHMGVAAFLSTALMVGAAAAWQLLHGRDSPAIRKMLSMSLWLLLPLAPLQAVIGDLHGLNTLKYQPAKIAAIEGHWENSEGTGEPLILFGLPDMAREETRFALAVPHLGSLVLDHSWNGPLPALKQFPPGDRPNATVVFWSFRLMVGLGLLMMALGVWSAWLRWRGTLWQCRPFLRFLVCMGPAGLVALLAGWITTEVGRQPWTIYGVLRTAEAVSSHGVHPLGLTVSLFIFTYGAVFGMGVVYLLRLIREGPLPRAEAPPDSAAGPAQPPLSGWPQQE